MKPLSRKFAFRLGALLKVNGPVPESAAVFVKEISNIRLYCSMSCKSPRGGIKFCQTHKHA